MTRRLNCCLHPLSVCLLAGSIAFISCSDPDPATYDYGSYQERQLLDPANSAGEWLERFKLDLAHQDFNFNFFTTLYAELPPMEHWPEIHRELDRIAGDSKQLTRLMEGKVFGNEPRGVALKISIFNKLLQGEDAEPLIRDLVKSIEVHHYRNDDALEVLFLASKDRDATLEWIRKNHPQFLQKNDSSYDRADGKKEDWQVALAENRIDEGIDLIWKSLAKERYRYKKANHLNQIIKIGLVLDREPLAAEATTGLMELLFSELKSKERPSSHTYSKIFDLAVRNEDWQSIVDTFTQISELSKDIGDQPSSYRFGLMDGVQAVYFTALHQLGRADDFDQGIARLQEDSRHHPDDFFRMLNHSATGHPPLGIIYLEHLKANGRQDEALAHALHLVARNKGVDAFYQALIDLDKARARSFITSLREYDPFEERPLIWLAELARRDGDLVLAQKTIEEAIALDPSDGDHGKDSRMFCYEVLARIHEDAGRAGEAEFFRSVVDSIRQGEAADDFLDAGLIVEAATRYKKALGQFEDAYCLQSRLALTLARHGRFEESVAHFKKAFELMPVSFGPRESHCFGCEGLFSDERVVEIALPILEAFEKEHPGNPRTPYLLGLVLLEKNEREQAATAFARAFEIDPGYYNAATRLLAILNLDPTRFEEAENLREKIFGIAPYPHKVEYLPRQAQLNKYWEQAKTFPPSPLDLPAVPFIAATDDAIEPEQYVSRDFGSFGYRSLDEMAMNGWSAYDIRRQNIFLKALDNLR